MKPTNKNSAATQAVANGDLFGIWVPTAERVPANPEGFPRNDHVPCLCAWLGENVGGDMRILQWNAYYKVWDDAYGDDFFCKVQEVTHWMPLPPWPNTQGQPRPTNSGNLSTWTRALALDSGSAFPTYAEMHKALDDLHIVCECATMPEVETWYRGDAFAKEARQRAIDVLRRHTYAEREREMLIGFREAVRRIAAKPIDSSDMMDEIEHLLSLPPNKVI